MIESKKYVVNVNKDNIENILALYTFSKSDLASLTTHKVSDVYNPVLESVSLSEYKWEIKHMCSIIQEPIFECAETLKNMCFDNFKIEVIYLSTERKEILVIADKVNDLVLEEYYSKTYDEIKGICPECVFMIAEQEDVDFSIMPKFNKIIEV